MLLPISTTVDLVNAGVSAYLAIRLARAMHQDPASRMLRYFFYTYCALTVAYVFQTVPRVFSSQEVELLGVTFSIATLCFLVAAAFFSRVILAYTLPRWARPFFPIYLGLAGFAFVWSLLSPAAPIVDTATGITNWNPDPGVGILASALFLLVLVPGAILFVRQAIQAKSNHIVRVRSITIGLGSAFLAASAVMVFLATSEVLAVTSDFFSSGGMLVIFLGAAYHRPKQLPLITPPHAI
ncbi:MAG: hypothetical protein AAB515_01345 [Patescibacteria group bacterium]